MNFEEMQALWAAQPGESLFAIDDAALRAAIQRKSRAARSLLGLFEWFMVGLNLLSGLWLIASLPPDAPGYLLILPATFIAFSLYSLSRSLQRQSAEARFSASLLGQLERAIAQLDTLIAQGRALTLRYTLPLALMIALTGFFTHKLGFALLFGLLLLPASYFGTRWEIRKWYLPKRRALESLRETLLARETP